MEPARTEDQANDNHGNRSETFVMKRKLLFALLWLLPCYFAGFFLTLWLLPLLGGSSHDSSMEAAMTGAFVIGPLGALVGSVTAACVVRGTLP